MSDKNFQEIFYGLREKREKVFSNYLYLFFILLFIIIFILSVFIFSNIFREKKLKVYFFDIGQGDSILIQTPDRQKILIDAGANDRVVSKLEKALFIFDRKIDLVLMTHGDSDHIVGFISIFPKYEVKNILLNGDKDKDSTVFMINEDKIEREVYTGKAKTYTANCGDILSFGEGENKVNIYILNPIKDGLIMNDTNDNSIIAFLIYKEYSFLFLGDASQDIENKIFLNIENCFSKEIGENLKEKLENLTVLKVSHHGSNTGTSPNFLKQIKPEYSIISVGENNRFNHPSKDSLETLEKYSKNILNTIESGDIVFETNGKDISIIQSK